MSIRLKQRIKQAIKNINIKSNIPVSRRISVFGLGGVSTLLILLMVQVFSAQLISDFLIGYISDNLMLLIIISSFFLLTVIVSFIVGYFITQDVALRSVRNSSGLSLMCLFLFLFILCNGLLYLNYPNIYKNIIGFDIIFAFPQVLVKFSIYVLNDVFSLFIMVIVVYYILFVFFLEQFYIPKRRSV